MKATAILFFVLAAIGGISAVVAGTTPMRVDGLGEVCPSVIQNWSGQATLGQGFAEILSGGACTQFLTQQSSILTTTGILAVLFIIVAILLVSTRKTAAAPLLVGNVPPSSTQVRAAAPTVTPAGWFPVPERPGQLRWWDGTKWTDNWRKQA